MPCEKGKCPGTFEGLKAHGRNIPPGMCASRWTQCLCLKQQILSILQICSYKPSEIHPKEPLEDMIRFSQDTQKYVSFTPLYWPVTVTFANGFPNGDLWGPLLSLPSFNPDIIKWCSMHTLNLGTSLWICGSTMRALLEYPTFWPGSSVDDQLLVAYGRFKEWTRSRKIQWLGFTSRTSWLDP